jgi:hypothetical protein
VGGGGWILSACWRVKGMSGLNGREVVDLLMVLEVCTLECSFMLWSSGAGRREVSKQRSPVQ